jgi:uncharacterized protein YabN with tetrapyrrole methylase and pyrophosphatase domain
MKDLNISEKDSKVLVQAMRNGVRVVYRGLCNVEELFTLTQPELNGIYKSLTAERNRNNDGDSLTPGNSDMSHADLRIEAVRIIYMIKDEELTAERLDKERQEKRSEVLELIARKKETKLENQSLEELEALYRSI